MPQVDLEAVVSVRGAGGSSNDRKIASVEEPDQLHSSVDDPPESFWLSQDAEYDWFDRNAVLERKDSTKGNSSSTPSHLSNSQRLSVKKSILALPKPKRSVPSDGKYQRNRSVLTFFPRRSASTGGKYAPAALAEPSSPKVSCMGRVRSKRDKNNPQQKTATSESENLKSEKTRKKKGFWKTLGSFFRSSKHESHPSDALAPAPAPAPVQNNVPMIEPAGLLVTKRFASGRRSDSWIGNLDSEQPPPVEDVVISEPLVCESVLVRITGRPLSELNCDRDSSAAGPVQA